ncbi:hypothetical protein OV203_11115 [Nannocystis sp. ILAH1]|uniref:hypothetical protein n=1 Tax=Nannocystis sp. ILAH1 TaxID=2996789 RepID=UPI00226D5173|nr:hypothetical protein [Nannocystis sp. ILAH1]MCY0987677.1 hypothetical protein [Nannocystis sp. ILAH1]
MSPRARAASWPSLVRCLLGLAVAAACRPGGRDSASSSPDVDAVLAAPLPRSAPIEAAELAPEPAPTTTRPPSRRLGETLVDGPLVEAAPDEPCPQQRPCTMTRVPASFRVRARIDGGGRESAALLARIDQNTEAFKKCMDASLRRDRCIRSGLALLVRLQASGAPEWIAVDGAADDRSLACLDHELRGLHLHRFVPPGAGPLELRIVATYRPAHRAYYRDDGVGLAQSEATDDPPCSSR